MNGCQWGAEAEVITQLLRNPFDGSFGGIVGRVPRGVGDTLFRPSDDDRGGGGLGADARKKGRDAVDDAKEVGVYDLGGV